MKPFTLTPHQEVEDERRRALGALLRNPLLPAAGETAEEYVLVRRHSEWLKQWLAKFPAWTLHVDREVARLRKTPADHLDETRAAADRSSGTLFTRRRYTLLCLVLAALERSDRQTTLSQIAQTIVEFGAEDGMAFDFGNYFQRRDLVHAVRLLMDTGVLRRLDGDEQQFLSQNASGVSYEICRPVLALILNISASPSALEAGQGAAALVEEPMPEAEEARSPWIRARLVRALLDDPILYFDDLNDEERTYFEQHRGYLLHQVHEATGLVSEVRSEGVAMVDADGDLTDIYFPEEGDACESLRVAQWLAKRCRGGERDSVPEAQLSEDILFRLRALRLVRLKGGGVVPMAACGRYRQEE